MEWKLTILGLMGLFGLYLVGSIFVKPLKLLFRVCLYFVFGIIMLFLANLICSQFGFHIAINPVTILTAGLLQLPGVILLVVAQCLL